MDRAIIEHDLKMAFDDGYLAGYEAAQPKWISVEERLPEKTGKYIVCTAKKSVYCTRFETYHGGGGRQGDLFPHLLRIGG